MTTVIICAVATTCVQLLLLISLWLIRRRDQSHVASDDVEKLLEKVRSLQHEQQQARDELRALSRKLAA